MIDKIYDLIKNDNGVDAIMELLPLLNECPDDPELLYLTGCAYNNIEKYGLGANLLMRAVELAPNNHYAWANLGFALFTLSLRDHRHADKAFECAQEALRLDPGSMLSANILSNIYIHNNEPEKALEWANRAIKADPELNGSRFNAGIAHLMMGDWKRGWMGFEKDMKGRFKKDSAYPQPKWDGGTGRKVIVYGEQGLGDEIMFASIVSDLQRDCDVVLDCDARLRGLYGRSFDCEVHGDRFNRTADWHATCGATHQIPIGSLAFYYRNHNDDFPGTPYFKADPYLRSQYRHLLDNLSDKPKIGLAWSGGMEKTSEDRRSLSLNQLSPLLQHEAEFISLQYKNPPKDGVHHWPHIVENQDMDHVAALIAELDLVISVTTTAVHLCGALGKECWVMVPEKPQWRYALPVMPWYNSVELFRQEGSWPIQEISRRLSQRGILKSSAPSMKTMVTVSPRSDTLLLSGT